MIVRADLQKLATSKDTPKHATKEKQKQNAQNKKLRSL